MNSRQTVQHDVRRSLFAFLALSLSIASAAIPLLLPTRASARVANSTTTGPFVTLLFASSEVTAADNCVSDDDGIARLDTVVAPYLQSLGLSATGTLVTGLTQPSTPRCTHYNDSLGASWTDATNLAQNYGWSFVSHTATYSGRLSTLPPAQQFDQTCGSAATIDAHGLPGGHGLIAYPGAHPFPTQVQTDYGANCFAWGRQYSPTGVTAAAAAAQPPYVQQTRVASGGPCDTPSAPCHSITAQGSKHYMLPSTAISIIQSLQPGQWFTLQSFVLVTGTNPPYTNNGTRWDCTSSDPALHWTNDVERYCYSDWQTIVNAIAAMPNITVTDPLTVGVAFGRPASYPDPIVRITQPASNSTVSGTLPLSGTAQPQGEASIDDVQISVDNGPPQPATGGTDWTASIDTTALANGPHTITATATDSDGNTGTSSVTVNVDNSTATACPATPAGATELSGNVSLESSQAGWTKPYNAHSVLSRVEPADGSYDGLWALRASLKPGDTGTAGVTNADPTWVGSTTAGQMYTASAFVRASTPGAKVRLALREKPPTGTPVGSHVRTVTLNDKKWHRITSAYTAHATGNLLHYSVYASHLTSPGQHFLADCLSLQTP
jgi:Bacterial Ig domain